MAGLSPYLGYVPYNAVFFERMIASFHYKSNVGFIMYVAHARGGPGSVSVLPVKELGHAGISGPQFFKEGVMIVAVGGGRGGVLARPYFVPTAAFSSA